MPMLPSANPSVCSKLLLILSILLEYVALESALRPLPLPGVSLGHATSKSAQDFVRLHSFRSINDVERHTARHASDGNRTSTSSQMNERSYDNSYRPSFFRLRLSRLVKSLVPPNKKRRGNKQDEQEKKPRRSDIRRRSRWYNIRKFFRSKLERYTVYVLECDGGKYYVGTTQNKKQRFEQHFDDRGGSAWTKKYRPIRILEQYRRVPKAYALGMESQVTARAMLRYGVNNCRGAMFTSSRPYDIKALDALTGFLGHYNNLNYDEVREYLRQDLPRRPGKKTSKKRSRKAFRKSMSNALSSTDENIVKQYNLSKTQVSGPTDVCFNCGQKGHWARDCIENVYSLESMPHNDANKGNIETANKPTLIQEFTVIPFSRMDRNKLQQYQAAMRKGVNPNDVCYRCGQKGHWARDCIMISESQLSSGDTV